MVHPFVDYVFVGHLQYERLLESRFYSSNSAPNSLHKLSYYLYRFLHKLETTETPIEVLLLVIIQSLSSKLFIYFSL